MSGIRIGVTQPVTTRVEFMLAETTSASLRRLRNWLDRAVAKAEPVYGQQLANVLVALLTPAAGVALVMGLWRLCADLGWTEAFPIAGGLFSHWQVWIALAIALKLLSSSLLAWANRISKIPAEN